MPRCCGTACPSSARPIRHTFIADLAWCLGDTGFDTKAALDFADVVCEVDRSGEKGLLWTNGLARMVEDARISMDVFLRIMDMLPCCGGMRRTPPARISGPTYRRMLPWWASRLRPAEGGM